MSCQWKAGNQAFDRHLAHQRLLPRGPSIACIHTSDRWGEAPYAPRVRLGSGDSRPGSTQRSFIGAAELSSALSNVFSTRYVVWGYRWDGKRSGDSDACVLHARDSEPTHYQCIRAAFDATICTRTPDVSLLHSPCAVRSVPERKE